MFLSQEITWSEPHFKKINRAALWGMISKTERMGAGKLVRKQMQSS